MTKDIEGKELKEAIVELQDCIRTPLYVDGIDGLVIQSNKTVRDLQLILNFALQQLSLTTKAELDRDKLIDVIIGNSSLVHKEIRQADVYELSRAICSHFSKPQTEPNIPEKSPTCVDLNYKCTLAKFVEQIGIKLWQGMCMMKYADFSKPVIKYPEKKDIMGGISSPIDEGYNSAIDDMKALNKEAV